MALSNDRITQRKEPGRKSYPVAASTLIYAGALVALNTSGYAVPAADTVGFKVVGIAHLRADNSAGSNGDINVLVDAPILALFDATSITQAMVGQRMYVVDDHTFDDTKGTNGISAGILAEYVSTTSGWLFIAASQIGDGLVGVANGYKIARGEVTLDGSNPTPVTTGLATVVAANASLKQTAAPGDDPSWLSVDYGGSVTAGELDIYAWKNTGGTDPTLVASTNNTAVISWIAIGT